jgi:hypothetical protein
MASIFTVNYSPIQNALGNRRAANEASRFSQSISRASEKLKTSGDAIALRHSQASERMMQDYENNNATRELNYRHAEESRNLKYGHDQQIQELNLINAKKNVSMQMLNYYKELGQQAVQMVNPIMNMFVSYKQSQVQGLASDDVAASVPLVQQAIASGTAFYNAATQQVVWDDGGAQLNQFMDSRRAIAEETLKGWGMSQYNDSQKQLRSSIENSAATGSIARWSDENAKRIVENQQAALNMDIANGNLSAIPEVLTRQYGVESVEQLPPIGQLELQRLSNMFYGTDAANGQHGPILEALAAGASPESVIEQAKRNTAEMLGVGSEQGYGSATDKQIQADLANGQIEAYVKSTVPAIQEDNQNKLIQGPVAYAETIFTRMQQELADGKIPNFDAYIQDTKYLISGEGMPSAAVKDMPTLNQFMAGGNIKADDWDQDKRRIENVLEGLTTGKIRYFSTDKDSDGFPKITPAEFERGSVNLVRDVMEGVKYDGRSLDDVVYKEGFTSVIIDILKSKGVDTDKIPDEKISALVDEYNVDLWKAMEKAPQSLAIFEQFPEYKKAWDDARESFIEGFIGNEAYNKMTNAQRTVTDQQYTELAMKSIWSAKNGYVDSAINELNNINAVTIETIQKAADLTEIGNNKDKAVLAHKLLNLDPITSGKNGTEFTYEPTLDGKGRINIDEKIEMVHAADLAQVERALGIQRGPSGEPLTYGITTKFVREEGGDFIVNNVMTRSDGSLFEWRLNETQDDLILYRTITGVWIRERKNGKDVTWTSLPPTTPPPSGSYPNRPGSEDPLKAEHDADRQRNIQINRGYFPTFEQWKERRNNR